MQAIASISRRSFVAAASCVALGALSGAKLDLASADEAVATEADLIVVGAGAAGLAGAAKAAQDGASVIVLEAASVTGGTTKICGGHYKFKNEAFDAGLPERTAESDATFAEVLDWDPADFGDYAQACEKCKAEVSEYLASDSKVWFDTIEYWLCMHHLGSMGVDMDGVEARDDYDVVAPAYYNSGEVADWLAAGGMKFSDPQPGNVNAGGPLSVEPEGMGFGMIQVLEEMAVEAGAQIVFGAKASELVFEDGRVRGVVADVDGERITYVARKGVLLACGGYASNGDMVAQQRRYVGIDATAPSCEPAANDGTGIMMAQALGAATANMSFVQFFGFPEAQMGSIETLFPLMMGTEKLLVNLDGKRFTNDGFGFFGGGNGEAVRPICDQPSGRYFFIGDAEAQEKVPDYADRLAAGVIIEGETALELAEAAGIDSTGLESTISDFNAYVEAGEDPDFGRDMSQASKVESTPLVAVKMAAYAQNTMGGVVINPNGEVVDEQGAPIAGLYAAGEVVGNTDGACRRHGDNFAHILYYGWLAGKTVAAL